MSTSPAKERRYGRTIMSESFITGSRDTVRQAVFKDFAIITALPDLDSEIGKMSSGLPFVDGSITFYGAHPDFDIQPEDFEAKDTPMYDVFFNEDGAAYFKEKV